MLDFENCQSLEKLVLDNEICGMTLRLVRGMEPKEDLPSMALVKELLTDGHLLISKHSRRFLKTEHYFPGPVINRANLGRFIEEGEPTLEKRARGQVEERLKNYQPSKLADEAKRDLVGLMEREARRFGQNELPARG